MSKRIMSLLLWCACFCMCSCQSIVKMSENRKMPENPEFTIIPELHQTGIGIDFNAVYCREIRYNNNGVPAIAYEFYRFWNTGHVLQRVSRSFPDAVVADDFTKATMGYYCITNKVLITESYGDSTDLFSMGLNTNYFQILSNGDIQKYKFTLNGQNPMYVNLIHKRIPITNLKCMPDW
jgi:hypothetical protein